MCKEMGIRIDVHNDKNQPSCHPECNAASNVPECRGQEQLKIIQSKDHGDAKRRNERCAIEHLGQVDARNVIALVPCPR